MWDGGERCVLGFYIRGGERIGGKADVSGGCAGKLLDVLRAFPKDEPTKKRFVNEMIAWSAKAGEYPNGDPELHHVAGTLFAEGMSILS